MSPRPTVLLIPGSFGAPANFDRIVPFLKEAGLGIQHVPIPSSNPKDPASTTYAGDVAQVRDRIFQPIIEVENRDVVVIAHSYGDVVAADTTKSLDVVTRRSQDLSGGVLGLIYIVGNITLKNETLLHAVGGAWPAFIKRDEPAPGLAIIDPVMETLYGDCDPALKPELEAGMIPHAYHVFDTPAPAPAWADSRFDGRRLYIRTANDACNPAFLQDMWLEKSAVGWEVIDFQTSHGPFISQPQALAQTVIATINKWGKS